jgi:hypothetical protein
VEIERARLTRKLAAIREAEGNINEAADTLQEVAVVGDTSLKPAANAQPDQEMQAHGFRFCTPMSSSLVVFLRRTVCMVLCY